MISPGEFLKWCEVFHVTRAGNEPESPPAYSSFVISNSSVAMSVQTSYSPIPGISGFVDINSSDFTNSLVPINFTDTPAATYTGSSTQYFSITALISALINTVSTNTFYLNISILKADSTIVTTSFENQIILKNINDEQLLGVTGIVELNTGDGIFYQIKASSPNNMNVKFLNSKISNITGGGGTQSGALLSVNNLSDVQSISQSVINLGLQNGYVDFNSNGNQILTAPLPRKIGIGMTAGTNTIQFPDATTLNSNTLGDRFYIQNYGSVAVTFLDGTGASLQIIQPGTSWEYSPESNSTVAGSWIFTSNVAQIYTQFGVSNSTYYPLFVPSNAGNTNQTPLLNTFFTFNPSSGILNTPKFITGEPFTPINCNIKSFVSGSDSSGTDAPGLGFFTNSDSYPLLQILPFTHNVTLFNFDCYSYNGAYYSSYIGSNFQIAKSNNQLQFNFRSGISPGSTFSFQPLGYFDSFGNFTLNGKFIMGNPSGSTNALVQFNSNQYGILPPVLNNSQETTLVGLLGSIDIGLQWFNSTTLTNNYWDGSTLQQTLTFQKLMAGSNIVFDDSVPGQRIINASGGGTAPTPSFASWAIQNNAITTSVQTFFTPISVPPDGSNFYNINSSGFINQVLMVSGVYTIVSTYIDAPTQYFSITANNGLINGSSPNQTYLMNISILESGGSIVNTDAQMSMSFPNFSQNLPESLTAIVQLNTGDSVIIQIKSQSSTNCVVNFVNFKITNIAGSLSNTNSLSQGTDNLYLSQNGGSTYQYLSGSAIVGDIPQFSSTGGQLIDSGIPSANLIQNTTSLGGSLTGNLPNPSLSSTGISQIIAITQVSGSTQAMTDSAPINRYILQNSSPCTLTLPASINAGHSFEIIGGRTAGWIIAQNSGQSIALGINITTTGTGGSLSSTNSTDSLILSCTTINTQLTAYGVQGNITYV